MNQDIILVVSNQVVMKNSKINWPDLNYPDSGLTILRTIHEIDFKSMRIQLDGAEGPWFFATNFPKGVGFYQKTFKPKA